jgi:pimeloyl-ACP methyl ester carboxylesterase
MANSANARRTAISLGLVLLFSGATDLGAQTEPLPTQMISVEGRAMRMWTAGIEGRKPGQPVVILESGANGDALNTWRPLFPEIARIAPVVAYERRGFGMSEPDLMRPTLRRTVQSLHGLLQAAKIPPPYVLVGQSLGGIYIRGFGDQYPNEVVGLVYPDVPDFESTREEKAAALPPENRAAALAPPVLPPIPPNTPPGVRAEFEEMAKEWLNDFPVSRALRQPSGIPVAVVVATPPGRLRGNGGAMVRLQMKRQSEWALSSSNGLFVTANHVGHWVHRDDPALVARLIKHVLDHVGVATRDLR